jgi:hypothetical protein
MNKLLRLFLFEHLKLIGKGAAGSAIIAFLALQIFKFNAVETIVTAITFYTIFAFSSLGMSYYGNNLHWLINAPISRRKILLYNCFYNGIKLFSVYFIPFLLGLFALSSPQIASIKIKNPPILSSYLIEIGIFIFLIHLCLIFNFNINNQVVKSFNLTKKIEVLHHKGFWAGAFILAYILLYDVPHLIFAPFCFAGLLVYLWYDLNKLRLVQIKNYRMITTMSLVVVATSFTVLKFHSNNLLNSPLISTRDKIQEISFQGRFQNYLKEETLTTLMKQPLDLDEAFVLKEAYGETQFNHFLNKDLDFTLREIVKNQKNPDSIRFFVTNLSIENFNQNQINGLLDLWAKNVVDQKALPDWGLKLFSKLKLKREDILSLLVDKNNLKHSLAIHFASDKSLELEPEILKHIADFSDQNLELVKLKLSVANCRTISSVELMNSHKNEHYHLPSHCSQHTSKLDK